MTTKQLQTLIAAGVFSASLLTGIAHADDMSTVTTSTTTTTKMHHKHKKAMTKSVASHTCKGQNDCKGQGGCKAGAAGCAGKNDCKGQGGCATDGSKK